MKLRERMQNSGGTVSHRFLELNMKIRHHSNRHSFSEIADGGQQDLYLP